MSITGNINCGEFVRCVKTRPYLNVNQLYQVVSNHGVGDRYYVRVRDIEGQEVDGIWSTDTFDYFVEILPTFEGLDEDLFTL